MGMFGGSSSGSESSSESNTQSWLAEMINPIVADFINSNPTIDYIESGVAELPPAMQKALDAYGSGAAIDAGKKIAGAGGNLAKSGITAMGNILNGGASAFASDSVAKIMGALQPAMTTQSAAIADQVYSDMGAQFGTTAQSTMSNGAASGSSANQQATNAVLSSGANSMIQLNTEMQGDALSAAIGMTGEALSGGVNMLESMIDMGGNIFNAGAGMASEGMKNQFNSGLYEQWYNQQVLDNNRKNDMTNANMEWLNMAALLSVTLPTAGLDVTTKGNSESSRNSMGGRG